jgi:hypothetical protein
VKDRPVEDIIAERLAKDKSNVNKRQKTGDGKDIRGEESEQSDDE